MMPELRQPIVAGRFYPAGAEELRAEVQDYLAKADKHRTECAEYPVLGCMVPHAGYVFSGIVAGLTLGQIEVPETVLLLGPNHTGRGAGLALWPDGAWRTPLGDVPVDADGVQRLVEISAGKSLEATSLIELDRSAHLQEHSLEVVLPFLQLLQKNLKILPLCVRNYNPHTLPVVGASIAEFVRERQEQGKPVLLVTSSDMSHYLPHEQGKKLDRMALEKIMELDAEGLFRVCALEQISMCGFIPMSIMLYACKSLGASRACVTAHTSSGVTGQAYGADMNSVVGYAGVIIS